MLRGQCLDGLPSLELEVLSDDLIRAKTLLDRAILARRCEEVKKAAMAAALEKQTCVACFEKKRSVALLPCGHVCLCEKCAADKLLLACPLCRSKIDGRMNVYLG